MYSTGNYYLVISEAWLDHQQKELVEKNEQINEVLRQQNQKLLVESKRTWIRRLFGLNEREV